VDCAMEMVLSASHHGGSTPRIGGRDMSTPWSSPKVPEMSRYGYYKYVFLTFFMIL